MHRFGVDPYLPFDNRVATVAELCRRGWAGQMVLSHDARCFFDFFQWELIQKGLPRWNFRHIPDDVIPALRKQGIAEEHIRPMTVENPRRVFGPPGAD